MAVVFSHKDELEVAFSHNGEWKTIRELIELNELHHYKARAECFPDVLEAFRLFQNHEVDVMNVSIKQTTIFNCEFDFVTSFAFVDIQKLLDTGTDLHRIIQTIKPIKEYTGEIDNSFWKKE